MNAFMHQAQASSTTSLTNDNCSSLDIKPSIQQNGGSNPSSGQKQREGTTTATALNNSGNTNTNNNNNNSNANSNNSNNNSSLNGGLFDNPQSAYGGSAGTATVGGYDSSYHGYHQTTNSAAFQSLSLGNGNSAGGATALGGGGGGGGGGGNGGSANAGLAGIRSNMSPHHHHHSAKPHRTKPRTSAGKKHNFHNRHGVGFCFIIIIYCFQP